MNLNIKEIEMPGEKTTVSGWFLRYILPVIIVPILTSSIISYGAVSRMENQQVNDSKRIDQVQVNTNINRVEISKNSTRISKIEVIIENIDRTLERQAEISDKNLTEMRKIRGALSDLKESVAVLKDREERQEEGG